MLLASVGLHQNEESTKEKDVVKSWEESISQERGENPGRDFGQRKGKGQGIISVLPQGLGTVQ